MGKFEQLHSFVVIFCLNFKVGIVCYGNTLNEIFGNPYVYYNAFSISNCINSIISWAPEMILEDDQVLTLN